MAARDPERTRERILGAALKEFSAKGLAGARVDAIARRARVNKRMLYHYFGNKRALFRAILERQMAKGASIRAELVGGGLPDKLASLFEAVAKEADWVRLVEWEALEVGAGPLIAEDVRQRSAALAREQIAAAQKAGALPRDLDPGHLLLTMTAVVAFPLFAPQVARVMTGLAPSHRRFRAERVAFLRRLMSYANAAITQRAGRRAS